MNHVNDDAVLLLRYVENGSEEAFAELVEKHHALVYCAALRRCGDAHRAADVTQDVFTDLAIHARALAHHPVLGAWLHSTTRNVAINFMYSDKRRKQRELTALMLETPEPTTPEPEWEHLRPVLDWVIDRLPKRDRQTVVMRFLERRPFKEIGAALKISEDAARVRTRRALERMRAALALSGITSSASALTAAVFLHATEGAPAPAGLAAAARAAGTFPYLAQSRDAVFRHTTLRRQDPRSTGDRHADGPESLIQEKWLRLVDTVRTVPIYLRRFFSPILRAGARLRRILFRGR